eukprot:15434983-Alexandrium_andersonii.AAC.1
MSDSSPSAPCPSRTSCHCDCRTRSTACPPETSGAGGATVRRRSTSRAEQTRPAIGDVCPPTKQHAPPGG